MHVFLVFKNFQCSFRACRFKKNIWRKTTPKGLKLKKFIEGPDGTLIHDPSYVGEDAWDDNDESLQQNLKRSIDSDMKLKEEGKNKLRGELTNEG